MQQPLFDFILSYLRLTFNFLYTLLLGFILLLECNGIKSYYYESIYMKPKDFTTVVVGRCSSGMSLSSDLGPLMPEENKRNSIG